MNVETFRDPPPAALASALAEFERQFTYPLGPGRTFRIEHGDDYARFYRAMGEACCFVCPRGESVAGVIAVAVRPLLTPDGERQAVYFGDVKVAREARGGPALFRLARQAEVWSRARAAVAFGVVMDGTPVVPDNYTGRAGIPPFAAVGKVMVLRFAVGAATVRERSSARSLTVAAPKEVRACYRRLSAGRYACPAGVPAERSVIAPVWLMESGGAACGCLEDTRRAKCLIADDGREMVSAHLSGFAYRDVRAGAELLRAARARAAALDFPALFVSVAAADAEELAEVMRDAETVRAPATVYAHGLTGGAPWNINSSEI